MFSKLILFLSFSLYIPYANLHVTEPMSKRSRLQDLFSLRKRILARRQSGAQDTDDPAGTAPTPDRDLDLGCCQNMAICANIPSNSAYCAMCGNPVRKFYISARRGCIISAPTTTTPKPGFYCVECGKGQGWIPKNTRCHDMFDSENSEVFDPTEVNTCYTHTGCYKGFLDVGDHFYERGCIEKEYYFADFTGTMHYIHTLNRTAWFADLKQYMKLTTQLDTEDWIQYKVDLDNYRKGFNQNGIQPSERYSAMASALVKKFNMTGRPMDGCIRSTFQSEIYYGSGVTLPVYHHVCICTGDRCNVTEGMKFSNSFRFWCYIAYFVRFVFLIR